MINKWQLFGLIDKPPSSITAQAIPFKVGLGEALCALAKHDPKLVVLTADLRSSLGLDPFVAQFPRQFIEVGVAEQNLMGVAAGLALAGFRPYVCGFAVFNPGRNWDQLRVSVCYSNLPVKVIASHAGLSVGADGATHQALEDLAITRSLPGLRVLTPGCGSELAEMVTALHYQSGPFYFRFGRETLPELTNRSPFKLGQSYQLRYGRNILILGHGALLHTALEAADLLSKLGIESTVQAMPTLKPWPTLPSPQPFSLIVTVEDHQISGGLGSATAEWLAEQKAGPLLRIGMKDQFGQSGTANQLYHAYAMDAPGMVEAIQTKLKELN